MQEEQPNIQIPWGDIDTILLDMDGTLLDLYFDNYFWKEYLPVKWGELHGMDAGSAKDHLVPKFRHKEGTLTWYCLDYWSEQLEIDILELKTDIEHLIRPRPFSREFLQFLRGLHKPVLMVTNAHEKLIELKLSKTGIGEYFDRVFCSHELGVAKEEVRFWQRLNEKFNYVPEKTLLVDDNLTVLRSARDYGIRHLFTIAQPDTQAPIRAATEFPAILSYEDLYQSAVL